MKSMVELPPPLVGSYLLPLMMEPLSLLDKEDTVSFLSKAMRQIQNGEDNEESVLLLITLKEDRTEYNTQDVYEVFTDNNDKDGVGGC